MLGWLRPKPPLAPGEKAWVETRLRALADLRGVESLLAAKVVRRGDGLLPAAAPVSQADAERAMRQICGFLPADAAAARLEICDVECPAGPPLQGAECQDENALPIPSTLLANPDVLVATLAQRLCRRLLQSRGTPLAEDAELDRLAELLLIWFGFGVFAANTATARGILPARLVSYALSLFAWVREEPDPSWAGDLIPESAAAFRRGLRYLRRSGDSLFQLAAVRHRYGDRSLQELSRRLKTGSPSARIAALWELAAQGPAASEAIPWVIECLGAREADVRAEAARTLGSLRGTAPDLLLALTDALRDIEESVRAAAAAALGQLAAQPGDVVPELAQALQDSSPAVVRQAALALSRFGGAAEPALNPLLEALRAALVDCHEPTARVLAAAVRAITPHPESHLDAFFDEHDTDLKHAACDLFAEGEET